MKQKNKTLLKDVIGMTLAILIYITPFYFIILNSLKTRVESNSLSLELPSIIKFSNYLEVIQTANYQVLTAFKNSILITFFSLIIIIFVSSTGGYIIQRRKDKKTNFINSLFMAGLMLPPAIIPTILVMQRMHIYKTLFSMLMIETALHLPFNILLYRGFMGNVPRDLEEAGYIDGCTSSKVFSKIIFPLLSPVTATIIILQSVRIFNDFMNPLYFFPGIKNVTVQLTLYNFMGQFSSSHNLLFADTIIITIPMLIVFIIFNKRIVGGMGGAVKG